MICTLTARRLTPGSGAAFRDAFVRAAEDIPEEIRNRWRNVFVCRDVTDEDVYLTFGFFDGTLEELREIQAHFASEGQVAAFSEYLADVLLDGSYEVVEQMEADR